MIVSGAALVQRVMPALVFLERWFLLFITFIEASGRKGFLNFPGLFVLEGWSFDSLTSGIVFDF